MNEWGCRIPQSKIGEIAAAVRGASPYLEPIAGSSLEFDDLRCSTLDVVERAYDHLTETKGIGPTGASAIMTVLNPRLFLSWGAGIRKAYFPNDNPNGATYSQFLTVMRMAALSIASDARAQGIDDPAGALSAQLGIDPPFSLAKFVDEYNWVTLERRHGLSGGCGGGSVSARWLGSFSTRTSSIGGGILSPRKNGTFCAAKSTDLLSTGAV